MIIAYFTHIYIITMVAILKWFMAESFHGSWLFNVHLNNFFFQQIHIHSIIVLLSMLSMFFTILTLLLTFFFLSNFYYFYSPFFFQLFV
jgi:hypothetical protein